MTSFSSLTDEELLATAHGANFVIADVANALQQEAANLKSWRMQFFNFRRGWILRSVVRHHRACPGLISTVRYMVRMLKAL